MLAQIVEPLNFNLLVAMPLSKVVIADKLAKECMIDIEGRWFFADLILLDMHDFDVVLGMDWMTDYHALVDCFRKKVIF